MVPNIVNTNLKALDGVRLLFFKIPSTCGDPPQIHLHSSVLRMKPWEKRRRTSDPQSWVGHVGILRDGQWRRNPNSDGLQPNRALIVMAASSLIEMASNLIVVVFFSGTIYIYILCYSYIYVFICIELSYHDMSFQVIWT